MHIALSFSLIPLSAIIGIVFHLDVTAWTLGIFTGMSALAIALWPIATK